MAGNYRKKYDVDIVLVIDATGSMQGCIQTVKDNANRLYDDICRKMKESHRDINRMRVRVIAFRDYVAYKSDHIEPMMVTPFFNMPEDTERFRRAVSQIKAIGGGDDPEDGLEALAFAIKSDWLPETPGIDRRQIIVLWTDAATHELGYGSSVDVYPRGMAKDFSELSRWWEELMSFTSKRLLLYAPTEERWKTIASGWKNVIHIATKPGQFDKTMSQIESMQEHSQIVELLVKTIQDQGSNYR